MDSWSAIDSCPDAELVGRLVRQARYDGDMFNAGIIVSVNRDARNGVVQSLNVERRHTFTYRGRSEHWTESSAIRRSVDPITVD